ncbi:hypothetical protein HA402_005220 [Bradysia odoriphaga]|nr:hypothetical protein HA402_005220 [Bradysia odoriphaga]
MGQYYGLTVKSLCKLMQCSGQEGAIEINKLGGVEGICEQLGTRPTQGITNTTEHRRATFGSNSTSTKTREKFLTILGDAFRDKLLITLLILLLILFEIHKLICVVVAIVATVAFDYFMVYQYRRYFDVGSQSKAVTVIRDATVTNINIDDVVVGDVCIINENNVVPADGILIESDGLKVDESFINGTSCYTKKGKHLDPMILCGSEIIAGNGVMVVTAVGVNTRKGQISKVIEKQAKNETSNPIVSVDSERLTFDEEASILRQKIQSLFWKIICICSVVCGLIFGIMIVQFSVIKFAIESRPWANHYWQAIVRILLVSIRLCISGIPESIVLVVPITLFITFRKLYQENVHLRRLYKCEAMGNVSSICFDKTGTLTTNKMEVVWSHICDHEQTWTTGNDQRAIPNNILKLIVENLSINSSIKHINNDGNVEHFGNYTELALLEFVTKIDLNFQTMRDTNSTHRVTHVYPFNSDQKFMGTAIMSIDNGNGYRLFIKGASEIVLGKCNFMFGEKGELMHMTNILRDHLQNEVIKPISSKRLRTITLAYRDFVTDKTAVHETYINSEPNWDDEVNIVQNLTFLGVLGIDDPIRPDAADTIKSLKSLGITVRMISGDDIETAKAVAIKCGIMETDGENVAMDAAEINRRTRDKNGVINTLYPNLRVIARASPIDKYNLIDGFKRNGEIVAMVGNSDGDALALKKADIGIILNPLGAVAAWDASTVVLHNGKLDGIVRTVLWGRNCYNSIAKFVQFALSAKAVIFVVTCLVSLSGAYSYETSNIFEIDLFLGILALVSAYFTHKITNDLSPNRSYGRSESIISKTMKKNICCQSVYQIFVLITLRFVLSYVMEDHLVPNIFIMMTFFNVFNSRKLLSERNIFDGICSNLPLCVVWVGAVIVHVLQTCSIIVYHGPSEIDECERLNLFEWIFSTLVGCSILIWHQLLLCCCREKPVDTLAV